MRQRTGENRRIICVILSPSRSEWLNSPNIGFLYFFINTVYGLSENLKCINESLFQRAADDESIKPVKHAFTAARLLQFCRTGAALVSG